MSEEKITMAFVVGRIQSDIADTMPAGNALMHQWMDGYEGKPLPVMLASMIVLSEQLRTLPVELREIVWPLLRASIDGCIVAEIP